jgi:membrane protease YdiL (CAAX protease family)
MSRPRRKEIRRVRAFLRRYQFLIFLILTIIFSWYPWYTGGQGFKVWGPSLAGLLVVAVVEGRRGLGRMLRRLVRWRVGALWWGIALLGPPIATLIAIGLHVITGGDMPCFTFWKEEWDQLPFLLLILLTPLFGGPGGEEPFGWRGYAQPLLQEKSLSQGKSLPQGKWGSWNPLFASLIIGVNWGVWHLPEFNDPASTQYAIGIGFFFPMVLMWISASVLMTWLYNKTGESVLIAGVIFHLSLDLSSATLLADFSIASMSEGVPCSLHDCCPGSHFYDKRAAWRF